MCTTTAPENTYTAYAAALGCTDIRDERDAQRRVNACLAALGCVRSCPRCWGSGHFSRNSFGSTTCYTCNGRGQVVVKITRKVIADAAKRVAAGELDAWRAANRARAAAKRALAPLLAAFDDVHKGNAVGREYSAAYDAKYRGALNLRVSQQVEFPEDLHRAQEMVNSIYSAVFEARTPNLYGLTPEQAAERVQWALAALPELLAAWAQYKADREAAHLARETAATVMEW